MKKAGPEQMKKFILLLNLLILLTTPLFAEGVSKNKFYGEIGLTPSLIDFIWTESTPDNHTLKRSFLGFDLTTEYFPWESFGFGQETQWRLIDKITIKSGSDTYTPGDVQGNNYFFRFTPQFLYAPLKKDLHMISLGFGPSFSMGYFLSKSADGFRDFYVGTTLKIRYRYQFSDSFYASAGWSLTMDFVYFGDFNELVFNNFIQIQNSPVLGIGYRR